MADRVYHVQSTGQLVILNAVVVQHVLDSLEAKMDAVQRDIDALRVWQHDQKEERCASRRTTGDSSQPSSAA